MSSSKDLTAAFLLPVCNAEKTIEDTIYALLKQDYNKFRIVIVENGSVDRTPLILKSLQKLDIRIKIFTLAESSITKALCYGLKQITEDLILRIDADDIIQSNRLSTTLSYMKENPKCAISYTDYQNKIGDKIIPVKTPKHLKESHLILSNPLAHSTYCIRSEVLRKYKFDYSGLSKSEDYFGPSQDLMLISNAIFNFNLNISRVEGTIVLINKLTSSLSTKELIRQKNVANRILLANSFIYLYYSGNIKDKIKGLISIIINCTKLARFNNPKIIFKIIKITQNYKRRRQFVPYAYLSNIQ